MKKTIFAAFAAALLMTACENGGQGVDVEGSSAPGTAGDFKKNIRDRVFFAFNKSDVSADAKKVLEGQAAWLKTYGTTSATLEGRCDERGTRDYNIALGAKRSESVKAALGSLGIDGARMKVVSFGKDKPVIAHAKTEEEHAQNRTVVTAIN